MDNLPLNVLSIMICVLLFIMLWMVLVLISFAYFQLKYPKDMHRIVYKDDLVLELFFVGPLLMVYDLFR